jgi:hypothetical protein
LLKEFLSQFLYNLIYLSCMKIKLRVKLLVFVLVLFALFSCCREDPVESERIALTENEQQLIPYEIGQHINFIHSNGYEFEFEVTDDTLEWQTYSEFCEWNCCGQEYISYQVRTTTLESAYPDLTINISIGSYGFGYYPEFLSLDINHRHFLSIAYDSLANFACDPRYGMNCLDSVIIRDKTYKDVVEKKFDSHYFIEDSTILIPESVFYNHLGLLQIKMSDEETFSVNP